MKLATFTDHIKTPSSRFRIRQYFPWLEEAGIIPFDYYRKNSIQSAGSPNGLKRIRNNVLLMGRAAGHEALNLKERVVSSIMANTHDAIWLSRHLVVGYPTFEFMLKKPIIYDIDDAVFLNNIVSSWQFKIITSKAFAVIAGNDFLAENAARFSRNVHVVPTSVDTSRWFPLKKQQQIDGSNEAVFNIGWCGTSSSIKYFLPFENSIKRFLVANPSAKLWIMSDRFPHEFQELKPYLQFINWSVSSEVDFIRSLDVGLMPINDDLWCRGKCAYKLLLYAACGIPVIASPIGMNKVVLGSAEFGFGPNNSDEWYDALITLYDSQQMREEFSLNAVKLIAEQYAVSVCAQKIIKILKSSI
jgi:glycosyltransferase involved in cell wall biosynthesis